MKEAKSSEKYIDESVRKLEALRALRSRQRAADSQTWEELKAEMREGLLEAGLDIETYDAR